MTDAQLVLIMYSHHLIQDRLDQLSVRFYDKLFEISPSLKDILHPDSEQRMRYLMATMGAAVASARTPEALRPALAGIARRHVKYGAHAEHFIAFHVALSHALAIVLGSKFTPAVQLAWTQFYKDLVTMMSSYYPKTTTATTGSDDTTMSGLPSAPC